MVKLTSFKTSVATLLQLRFHEIPWHAGCLQARSVKARARERQYYELVSTAQSGPRADTEVDLAAAAQAMSRQVSSRNLRCLKVTMCAALQLGSAQPIFWLFDGHNPLIQRDIWSGFMTLRCSTPRRVQSCWL